ncbi:MAG: glycoside hydrolase family 15 protein [Chloroflexota bacterium]
MSGGATVRGSALADRSLAIIRAGQAPSGAFVASPTFSQYGFAWFRDGAFVAEGLDLAGELGMSRRFHDWVAGLVIAEADGVERAIATARAGQVPSRADYLHCRYTLDGQPSDDDWPAFQSDGPGIWAWSLAHHVRHGGALGAQDRDALLLVGRYLSALWATPCSDAWEEFPEHVHLGTQAAMLAGLRAIEALAPDIAALPEVAAGRSALEQAVLGGHGPWTKWRGTDLVDGSLLWLVAPYGLAGADHPRAAATLARIEADIVDADGGVHRYRDDTYFGGGAWPLLTAAYGRVLLRRDAPGDRARAERLLAWIEAQADSDGALPEQVDTHALHPERIAEWVEWWGTSARPLLWSHAAYLGFRAELLGGVRP